MIPDGSINSMLESARRTGFYNGIIRTANDMFYCTITKVPKEHEDKIKLHYK